MQLKSTDASHPNAGRSKAAIPFLEIRDVQKSFGGVRALKGVSFAIEPGQIYHLMGENGCGKSTLIKILSGAQPADNGELLIDGKPVGKLTPVAALAAGIETVYQDLSLLPNLSVAENVGLTQQLVASAGKLARRLDLGKMRQTAERALTASLDDLGSSTLRSDIASMNHESQYSRVFRS